jgi:DNA-binding PadR family transcriptional regulator
MHGYQVMQQLAERSGGIWQPSAGSIYPTLQQLEDEGLVTATEQDGRRVFSLTDAGRAAAEGARRGRAPWQMDGADEAADLRTAFFAFASAFRQVAATGSPETVAAAKTILLDARKRLYRLLAEEGTGGSTGEPTDD